MNSINPMHEWFMYLFEQRMDEKGYVNCFECNKRMHESFYKESSTCYSHILGKKQYPEKAGDPDNVVIVCPDCHNLFTFKPKQAFRQYAKLKEMLEEYES